MLPLDILSTWMKMFSGLFICHGHCMPFLLHKNEMVNNFNLYYVTLTCCCSLVYNSPEPTLYIFNCMLDVWYTQTIHHTQKWNYVYLKYITQSITKHNFFLQSKREKKNSTNELLLSRLAYTKQHKKSSSRLIEISEVRHMVQCLTLFSSTCVR